MRRHGDTKASGGGNSHAKQGNLSKPFQDFSGIARITLCFSGQVIKGFIKAADCLLLPMPEPRKATLLLWARESGGQKGTNYHCPGLIGERTAFLRQLFLSPSFLVMQKKERQRGSQPRFSSGHFPNLVAGADRH